MARVAHGAAALALAALAGGLGAGCPAREQRIDLTVAGLKYLLEACIPTQKCPKAVPTADGRCCNPDTKTCNAACEIVDGECIVRACGLPGHPPPTYGRPMQARLMLVERDRAKVRAKSECMAIFPCPNTGTPEQKAQCLVDTLDQALDGSMPDGLTYDDLEDLATVDLVLALFVPPEGAEDDAAIRCRHADLFACAGLTIPADEKDYDVTCGSCQGGSREGEGVDTGPCPRVDKGTRVERCFLELCGDLVKTL